MHRRKKKNTPFYSLNLAPQFSQNFMSGTFVPHFGQRTCGGGYKERPQYPQNLKSSAFLPPQLRQTITFLIILSVKLIFRNIYGTRNNPNPKPKPAETASPTLKAASCPQITGLRHRPKSNNYPKLIVIMVIIKIEQL